MIRLNPQIQLPFRNPNSTLSIPNTVRTHHSPQPMSFPYSTLPLPPSTHFIRVLKLPSSIPSTQPPTHSLTGTLHLVDLNANPPPNFTALSYVWGVPDPHTDYAVLCGGYRIPITPNCFAALSALSAKKSRSAEEGLTIWVDAICINQSDEEEKMRQIPLMGEIYHRAAETYIWLGEETKGHLERWWAAPLRLLLLHSTNYVTKGDMIDLLDTAWISRLWTYQEFLLSSNPIFVCGQHHLPWPQMARAMLFLRETVDRYGTQSSRWVNLIISKHSMLPAQEASDLANYWTFILRISSVYWALVYSFVPLLLTLFFITIWIFFYDTGLRLGHGLTKPALYILIAFVSFLALCAAVLARCLHRYRYWCVNPGPTGDDFLVELYTRRAKDPKDMAYGAWAVLKRKGGAMGTEHEGSADARHQRCVRVQDDECKVRRSRGSAASPQSRCIPEAGRTVPPRLQEQHQQTKRHSLNDSRDIDLDIIHASAPPLRRPISNFPPPPNTQPPTTHLHLLNLMAPPHTPSTHPLTNPPPNLQPALPPKDNRLRHDAPSLRPNPNPRYYSPTSHDRLVGPARLFSHRAVFR
ncbi:hypothetical protein GRF29_77g352807 [Pseudopithomyces chartarum]|uniref:Heterokaryon incompatibility domain-containing protein n=1 Tax=Pseudopithomyces chartarum TaxID=1892770 RepID=A0AAN6LZP5_9PLEO|nr:hypothetical protein GRF29_77g352807 [Pseudopithomyces chartarum]